MFAYAICRLVIFGSLALSVALASAAAAPRSLAVLIIDEADASSGVPTKFASTLRTTLSGFTPRIAVFGETLDLTRFSGPEQEAILCTFIQQKYRNVHFDVVLAVGASAFDLVNRWRSDLWPGVPVIFAAIDEMTAAQLKLGSNTTGLIMHRTIKSMMSLAGIFIPNLEGVAVVGGSLDQDAYRHGYVRELPTLAKQTKLTNLTGRTLTGQIKEVASLSNRTAILYTSFFIDDAGTRYSPEDALVAIAAVAKAPIVIDVESQMGLGATGGFVLDNVAYGREVAALVHRVLDGESADAIPVRVSEFTQPIFDWRELQRWRINESTLPQGSEIRYRPHPAWVRYRWHISVIATVFFAQILLILGLFYHRRRRRLRESEERFRGIYENAATGIAILDMDHRFECCNPSYAKILGYSEQELRELAFLSYVHSEDRDLNTAQCQRLLRGKIPYFGVVNRYIRKDGTPVWVDKHISLLRDDAGRPANILTLVTDVTERKRQDDQIHLLMREVNHRSKNMLSLVQAIASQTVTANPEDFLDRFQKRVEALAANQDLLVQNTWKGADLHDLVRSQLAHFEDLIGARIELNGTPLFVSAAAAQTISMALHELSTNAGKYGALSSAAGRIEIAWKVDRDERGIETFFMSWSERCEKPINVPLKQGFGFSVISTMSEMALGAKVDLDFPAAGLTWRLTCPTSKILGQSSHSGSTPAAEKRNSEPGQSSGPKVLIVEDEVFVAMEIARILREAGFNVAGFARSVLDARQILERSGCDAAVLDINLGTETSEVIAAELTASNTPFVILSGYGREQHSVYDGATALTKPLRPALLVAELRKCMEKRARIHPNNPPSDDRAQLHY
jgi:PAS domain S-box-containing protein